jgi:hypothetical protein
MLNYNLISFFVIFLIIIVKNEVSVTVCRTQNEHRS